MHLLSLNLIFLIFILASTSNTTKSSKIIYCDSIRLQCSLAQTIKDALINYWLSSNNMMIQRTDQCGQNISTLSKLSPSKKNCDLIRLNYKLTGKLTEGLVNYWPFSNHTCDVIGDADLYGGVNTAFSNDKFTRPLSALSLNHGYLNAPPGIYFKGGDFTLTAWIYIRDYNDWLKLFDFGNGSPNDNIGLILSYKTAGLPIFFVYKGKLNLFF